MPAGRLAVLCFLVAAGLNLAWLGLAPLADSTEARHAEIGREFVASGHWLVPTLNGRPHLTKPPLTDWLVAAGIGLFGATEFGARFANALLAALMLALGAGLARRLGGVRAALAAAGLGLVSPLYLALSRTISVDIALAAATTGGCWALWELSRPDCRRPWAFSAAFWLCAGLGALAKGHIVLLFLVAPAILWCAIGRRGGAVRRLLWPPFPLLMLAVGLPWPAMILREFPDWLDWTADTELGSRLVSRSLRDIPFGLSAAMLAGGVLPALPLIPFALQRDPAGEQPAPRAGAESLLWCWLLPPLAVLSMVNYQRPNYVVPLVPPAVILAGLGWARLAPRLSGGAARLARTAAAAVPLLCAGVALAAVVVLALRQGPGPGWALPSCSVLAAALAIAGAPCVWACARGQARRAERLMLAPALLLWASSLPATLVVKATITSRESCRWLAAQVPGDTEILAFKSYVASGGFYLRRALRPVRLVSFEKTPAWIAGWDGGKGLPEVREYSELPRLAARPGGVWMLLPAAREEDLHFSLRTFLPAAGGGGGAQHAKSAGLALDVFALEPAVRVAHLYYRE
jgi:4-amino-4-deoxy-L-arabinose transferase-like glycosyltransferase